MKKHIVFDFDDTLSSSYELNQQLFVDTFTRLMPDIDQDYLRKTHYERRGTKMLDIFTEIVEKLRLNYSPEDLMKQNEELQRQNTHKMEVFDGVEKMLKHFKKRGKTLSICSNRDAISLEAILTNRGLKEYFDNIISCHDAGREKPDPYCLKGLMERYPKIHPSETVYFGDSKTDAEFATNAAIDFVVVDHYLNKKLFYGMILESFADAEDDSQLPND